MSEANINRLTWSDKELDSYVGEVAETLSNYGINSNRIESDDIREDPFCSPDSYLYMPGFTVTTDEFQKNMPEGLKLGQMTADEKYRAFYEQQGVDVRTAMRGIEKELLSRYPDSMQAQKKNVTDYIEMKLDRLEQRKSYGKDAVFLLANYLNTNLKTFDEINKMHMDVMRSQILKNKNIQEIMESPQLKSWYPDASERRDVIKTLVEKEDDRYQQAVDRKIASNEWYREENLHLPKDIVLKAPDPARVQETRQRFCAESLHMLMEDDMLIPDVFSAVSRFDDQRKNFMAKYPEIGKFYDKFKGKAQSMLADPIDFDGMLKQAEARSSLSDLQRAEAEMIVPSRSRSSRSNDDRAV